MPEQDVLQGGGGGGGTGVPPHAALTVTVDHLTVTFHDASTATSPATVDGLLIAYGDGTSDTPKPGATWTHTYPAAGGFRYLLIVTDSAGLTDQASATITTTLPPPAPPTGDFATTIDYLTVTIFDLSTAVPPAYIAETFADYGDGTTGQVPPGTSWKHTYAKAGTYTIRLSVIDSNGKTGQAAAAVTVEAPPPPPPTVDFSYTTDELTATFADHSAAAESATLDSLVFAFGDGQQANVQPAGTVAHTYNSDGAYGVELAATDSRGHTSRISKTVSVAATKPQTFPDWQKLILTKAKIPVNVHTLNWVNAWHQCVENRGKRNPLGAKHKTSGSSNFNAAGVQNYPSDTEAVNGTVDELEQSGYKNLLKILRSGDPLVAQETNSAGELEMGVWGVNLEAFDKIIVALEEPPPTTPGVDVPAGASKAWRNLLNFYDKKVPKRRDEAVKLAASYSKLFK